MKQLRALLGLAVVTIVIYVGYMFLPPYFANFQFQDDVSSTAKFSSVSNRTDEDVRQEVLKKAREHDIQLTPEQVQITRDGRQLNILVNYTVTVNLVGGKVYVLNFHVASDPNAKVG